jgi:hypothetical protein
MYTLQGKSNQHDTCAFYVSPRTSDIRFLWAISIRGNLSQAINSVGRTLLLSRKKGSWHNPQPGWVICRFATQFLSQDSHWSSNENQTSIDSRLLVLPGPYQQHVIGMFNTCSRVPTHRSLTDIGGGYHIETSEYPQHSPRPSFPGVSLIPLNGPPRLHFIKY